MTVDCLGEFVDSKEQSIKEKKIILTVLQAIYDNDLDAHISLKISQLGAEFDVDLAEQNLREIVEKAKSLGNIHINIDTEKYAGLSN
ncbi:hypothetical protein NL503_27645, partial [Klebsiella pneumoniae]|nr:hypothetical protein [Klebsiella pneumoniae]